MEMEKVVRKIARELVENRMVLLIGPDKPLLPFMTLKEIPAKFGHLYDGNDEDFYDRVMSHATQAEPMVGIVARKYHDFTSDEVVKITDKCFNYDDLLFPFGAESDIEDGVHRYIYSRIYESETNRNVFADALKKLSELDVVPNGHDPVHVNREICVKVHDDGCQSYAGIDDKGRKYLVYWNIYDGVRSGIPIISKYEAETLKETHSEEECKRFDTAIKDLLKKQLYQ